MSSPILVRRSLPKRSETGVFALINIDRLIVFTFHRIGQQSIVNIQAVPNYSKSEWTSVTLLITTMTTVHT